MEGLLDAVPRFHFPLALPNCYSYVPSADLQIAVSFTPSSRRFSVEDVEWVEHVTDRVAQPIIDSCAMIFPVYALHCAVSAAASPIWRQSCILILGWRCSGHAARHQEMPRVLGFSGFRVGRAQILPRVNNQRPKVFRAHADIRFVSRQAQNGSRGFG